MALLSRFKVHAITIGFRDIGRVSAESHSVHNKENHMSTLSRLFLIGCLAGAALTVSSVAGPLDPPSGAVQATGPTMNASPPCPMAALIIRTVSWSLRASLKVENGIQT